MNMYLHISITLFVLTVFACQSQRAQISEIAVKNDVPSMSNSVTNSENKPGDENVNELVETFTDDKNIGIKGKNKIEISEFGTSENSRVEIKFYSLGKDKSWVLKQNINLEKDGGGSCAMRVKDFNNDGFKDATFISGAAARGANEIRTLLIYDGKNDKLIHIKNSENYPNIFYNKELNCIGAQRFYGGTATDFARIEGDTLRTFAYVETIGNERKVYLIDKKGQRKLLRTDTVSKDEAFELYKTFNPPKAYTAEEIEQ